MQDLRREDGQDEGIGRAKEQECAIAGEYPGQGWVTLYCS